MLFFQLVQHHFDGFGQIELVPQLFLDLAGAVRPLGQQADRQIQRFGVLPGQKPPGQLVPPKGLALRELPFEQQSAADEDFFFPVQGNDCPFFGALHGGDEIVRHGRVPPERKGGSAHG